MALDLPPKLWTPPKPAILRAASPQAIQAAAQQAKRSAWLRQHPRHAHRAMLVYPVGLFGTGNGGNDSFTKLLLHCDGADGSTTFPDSSPSGHTISVVGNAQVDTAQGVFGASALFDGTGDYLSAPDHADWNLGSGEWTVDFRVRFAATGSNMHLVGQNDSGGNQRSWMIYLPSAATSLNLLWSTDGTGGTVDVATFTWSPSTDTWYHVEMCRTGNAVRAFVNGSQIGSDDDLTGITFHNSTALFTVGGNLDAQYLNGWMDEVRISKGIARHTANFTSPASEYY